MIDTGDELHGVDERLPRRALPGQDAMTFGGQIVETAAMLAGFLDPTAVQPTTKFVYMFRTVVRDLRITFARHSSV